MWTKTDRGLLMEETVKQIQILLRENILPRLQVRFHWVSDFVSD